MIAPWGKRDSQTEMIHPLEDHCLDVAIVFRTLLDNPTIGKTQNWHLSSQQQDRLAVIAFLHDLGKCNWGFQANADSHAHETAGHVLEAISLLEETKLQEKWPPAWSQLVDLLIDWFQDEEQPYQMLLASISHHGRPVSLDDYRSQGTSRSAVKWWSPHGDYDPLVALSRLAEAARRSFPNAFDPDVPPIDATPALQQRFAGLVMLADWIGSDTQFFPYRASADEDRKVLAGKAAQRALASIGITTPAIRKPKTFESVFAFTPTPLQELLAHTLEISNDTQLLLAESDTGSGKTEAALAWFFRLYGEGKVDGLYFALPTRVAARELYARVHRAILAAFDVENRPSPVLLAAPGYVKVDGEDAHTLLADPGGTLWDDEKGAWQRERLWSAERPKRFLAAPIAVGTIDQALLSVLQVKHSLLRSVCLDRHLLIVDEVHASDPYMRGILRVLLRGHLARGGWALLLSATLGEAAAALYFERDLVPMAEAMARPYPLLTTRSKSYPLTSTRQRTVEINLSPTLTHDEALIPRLLEALTHGARVLVICNTVDRANSLFQEVESAIAAKHPDLLPTLFALGSVCCPHHGRFAREDREQLDAAVTQALGKGSPPGARLLIGTQTLEQSLDIDADWLVTDLAPMDVLIQRLGRLHRHDGRARPAGFESPQALVRVPEKDLSEYLDSKGVLRAPAGQGAVYADGRVLALTWQSLASDPLLTLPDQSRARIECTTHPEAFANLPEVWRLHANNLEGKELGEIRQAARAALEEKPFGDLHYPDKSERIATRLGDPTYDIPLLSPMPSPFGTQITRISIPARWLAEETPPDIVTAESTPEGFCFAIGALRFRYTRFGLEKDNA